MTVPRRPLCAGSAAVLLAALLAGPALAAQSGGTLPPREPKVAWDLGPTRGGWCVYFLMAPKAAGELLLRGARAVPAREDPALQPALRRVITDEPTYADWIPAQICTWYTEGVSVNRRAYDRGDGGKQLALFWWGISATGERLGARPGLSQVVLGTNSSGLKRQMQLEFVEMERLEINRLPVKESEDEEFSLRLGRTTVAFAGHPSPDSSLAVAPVSYQSVVKGEDNRIWLVAFQATPTGIAGLSGSLRIQGKGDLAKSLTESPIRLVGHLVTGGTGRVDFVE
ncbi:MAG: hypothetical protein IPJ95_13780 [Gemmatimonadetes bacterium]|nr:hypothetical protein [Gemmatimonadota bacterium]MBK7349107.1 hypothetical protein [Gemmatimonadota bacterium]MBK7783736.1 hypothetical protein [Gemmatimonadota bacterium]MBK7924674.1 hypothetical protein [Gemmatimonadota bacterium]